MECDRRPVQGSGLGKNAIEVDDDADGEVALTRFSMEGGLPWMASLPG